MKFRTKLFYSFIALGLMSSLLALFIIYGEASRLIFEEIRSKVLSLAINAEQLIDPTVVQEVIDEKGNESSFAYKKLDQKLLDIRDVNRRSDIYVEFVYLLKQYPDSNHYFFMMDVGSDRGKPQIAYGDFYPSKLEIPAKITEPFVTTRIYSDQWGTWLSGYAPIYDAQGKELCVLGIDVRTEEIYLELEQLLLFGLIAFIVSIGVAVLFAYFLSKLVSNSLAILCETVRKIGKGDFSCRSPLHTRDEFNALSIAINKMARGLEERERLKAGFARYVSHYALEEILKLDKPIALQGERKKVTILFTDLRDFTMIAEELPPEEVLALLNECYAEMIEVIFRYGGTLDKFIGDGMMVEFGAPLEDKLQELHAVLAAVHMQLELDKLSKKWKAEGRHCFVMGVGIHTGLAVLGNVGSEKRMEYTAIGDAVNVAARLEQLTKKIDKKIIVSDAIYEKVKQHFTFEDLNEIEIPGRKGIIRAYCLDPYAQKNLHELDNLYEQYHFPEG